MTKTFVATVEELSTPEGVAAWDERIDVFTEEVSLCRFLPQATINQVGNLLVNVIQVFDVSGGAPKSVSRKDYQAELARRTGNRFAGR